MVTSYIIENDIAFQQALDKLGEATDDFRIPFGLIASNFYQSEKKIFALSGPGKYPDLSPRYKAAKARKYNTAYPILLRTGVLARSLLNRQDSNAEFFMGKKTLIMGTKVKYAIYHQLGTRKMPMRKPLFIDGGPTEIAKGSKTGRRDIWLQIIEDHISQLINKEFKPR